MDDPPALADLDALAERALEHAEGDAQATAAWQRHGAGERLSVEITCVIAGRAARAVAEGSGDEALRRAARAAALHARRPRAWPSAGLPEPAAGPAGPLPGVGHEDGALRVAIASARGVRVAWARSYSATPETPATETPGDPVGLPGGESPVVFGHAAVATILEHLRPAFGVELDLGSGPLHGRLGTRVAAAAVHLAALAGGYDAEGIPRRHVPLIEAGVATGRVHDTASAAGRGARTTGHATRAAALAPLPEHLALSPGDADGVEALCANLGRGLYVPALSPQREADGDAFIHVTRGAVVIEAGSPARPVGDAPMRIEPLTVLETVEALTARTRTLPLAGHGPGGPGSADVPALLARSSAG